MVIDKITEQKILDRARIEDFLTNLKATGKDLYTTCPICGKTGKAKGLIISPVKQIGKCFSCDLKFKGAVGYLMKVKSMTYPDSLEEIARHYSIEIEPESVRKKRLKASTDTKNTFRDKQLRESGLELKDIEVEITQDDKTTSHRIPFRVGTRDQYNNLLDGDGDDMLIEYYDLEGRQVKYKHPKSEKMLPLVRVRWQNPAIKLDKDQRPIKYQSPSGSGSHLYIPEKVRILYKYRRPVQVLFIQEGEKKAEKSCKHSIPSVGIMGIQNLGYDNQLPVDLQYIIHTCEVKSVCFLLDSDWNNLSDKLINGDRVDQRPKSFFYAVKNYKDYMRTLVNLGLAVEIYFGYVKPNEKQAKGIDDYLVQVLKGKEEKLRADIDFAMNAKDGTGEHVQVYKITQLTDQKLADLWLLNDAEKFVEAHRDELKDLAEFKIGKLSWRFADDGKLEMAQPLLPDETFFEEKYIKTQYGERSELSFRYVRCMNFLQNRGYYKYKKKSGEWELIHIDSKVVDPVDHFEVKDFVKEFCRELKREDVLDMLMRGGPQYLGPEKLSNLDLLYPNFERATKTTQRLFFRNKMWEISSEGIRELEYSQMKDYVWKDKIIPFDATITPPMLDVLKITRELLAKKEYEELIEGEFLLELTDTGKKCDFLVFLKNASLFTWRKSEAGEPVSMEELLQNNRHLLNKITALGYLLHDYKNASELKAVIAMDGKLTEVGRSDGRTGKSLMGMSISFVIPQTYIAAKSKRLTEDQFLFGEVSEKTRNIFLDDVRANIDFEFFYPLITGKLRVNPKGGAPFTLGHHETPKLLITTNHAINGEGTSTVDRQALISFSDFYDDRRKPSDISGRSFFGDEWDAEQWNLFYNFMAQCLVIYFRAIEQRWGRLSNQGVIQPPMENLELRRLRQSVGEDFLMWAEEYYAPPQDDNEFEKKHLNQREARKDLYNDFLDKFSHARKYVTASSFGKRMKDYCRYKGFHFNPHKPNEAGADYMIWKNEFPVESFIGFSDKSGGIEYYTIADNDWRN